MAKIDQAFISKRWNSWWIIPRKFNHNLLCVCLWPSFPLIVTIPTHKQLTSCYQSKYHYNLKELWFPLGLCEQEQMGHVIKLLLWTTWIPSISINCFCITFITAMIDKLRLGKEVFSVKSVQNKYESCMAIWITFIICYHLTPLLSHILLQEHEVVTTNWHGWQNASGRCSCLRINYWVILCNI